MHTLNYPLVSLFICFIQFDFSAKKNQSNFFVLKM